MVAPSGDSLLLDRRLAFAGEVAIGLRKRLATQLAQLIYASQRIVGIFSNQNIEEHLGVWDAVLM